MGANQFLTLDSIPRGAEGARPSIDTWTLVPSTGIDPDVTFIAQGNFIGTIAIEGSPDNNQQWSVLTQLDSGLDADTNIGPRLNFAVEQIDNANVRYLRANIRGRIIDNVIITLAAEQNCDCTTGGGGGGDVIQLAADDMRPPTTAGWYTLGIAPLDDDYGDLESALPVRNFPYSSTGYSNVSAPPTMLGAGSPSMEVPPTATTLALTFWVRNSYAAAAANARIRLAYLQNPNGSAHAAWATTDFTDIALPANDSLVRVTYTITLSALATPIIPGSLYTFQFARIAPSGTDLTNDFGIVLAKFSWS